jgi:hypothetical protein
MFWLLEKYMYRTVVATSWLKTDSFALYDGSRRRRPIGLEHRVFAIEDITRGL